MADKVQLIKEEIERRIEMYKGLKPVGDQFYLGQISATKGILQFIDSLPEKPTDETIKENYNERYNRIAQTEQFKESYCDKSLGKEEPGCEVNCTTKNEDLKEELDNFLKDPVFGKLINRNAGIALANHFTEWQKEKMNLRLQTEYEKGLFDMREEMMKDAVEANVYQGLYSKYVKERDDEALANVLKNYNSGDKVKIIIVKEEQ